jgi:hypothetical protein
MSWIQSHQELGMHPKTKKLARLLGVSRVTAVGHLQFLWWWTGSYAPDGELTRFDSLDVATGAEWEGDEEAFVEALVAAGFLDRDEDGHLTVHDWRDYGGRLIDRRKSNAARMRDARARGQKTEQREPEDTCEEDADHVQDTCVARAGLEERRGEERENPPVVPPSEGPPPEGSPTKPVRPVPKPRATRIPDEFPISDDMRAFADRIGLPDEVVVLETEKFLDHFRAKPEMKSDWVAAWRNWLRRVPEFVPGPARNGRMGSADWNSARTRKLVL